MINETGKPNGRRQEDLLAFLADEHKRYRAEILPLHPDVDEDCSCFSQYDIDKSDFLEALWDVISQHFDDRDNTDENENDVR